MVTLDDIEQARARLRGVAVHTPLVLATKRTATQQPILSRKAFNPSAHSKFVAHITVWQRYTTERELGVMAYSSGNHAQGVALPP